MKAVSGISIGCCTLSRSGKTGADFAKNAGYITRTNGQQARASCTKFIKTQGVLDSPCSMDTYPKSMLEIFKSKEQAQVPLLVGWNSAEIDKMVFATGHQRWNTGEEGERSFLSPTIKEALKVYPHGDAKEVEWATHKLPGFWSFHCAQHMEMVWCTVRTAPAVYRYLYSKLRPPLGW